MTYNSVIHIYYTIYYVLYIISSIERRKVVGYIWGENSIIYNIGKNIIII